MGPRQTAWLEAELVRHHSRWRDPRGEWVTGDGTDTFSEIENVTGGSNADTLTGTSGDKDPGGPESAALSAVQTLTCTQAEHHCLFTFQRDDTSATLQGALDLPCVAADDCHVNLVMWAWHPDARAGGLDKLLVGENEGDYLANGIAEGDKGRLMAVRERDLTAADRPRSETTGGGTKEIPTTTAPTIVYSHRLKPGDLVAGEQYLVEAKVVVDVSSRARFSTRMFVTKDPDATDPSPPAQIFPGAIGEHNGVNCTPGTSPCTIRKAAVFRVTDDLAGPVHINLVAVSRDGSAAAYSFRTQLSELYLVDGLS